MMIVNTYDLYTNSNGKISIMNSGFLEKSFGLSMCSTMKIKYTKVRSNNIIIVLRYDCSNDGDMERYENFIDKNYEKY